MPPKAGAQPNQSLIDGIVTLQALAISDEPIGCRELARRLGMETTRVNRLLKTLNFLGLAHQTANRKYTAGPGMHVLAAQSLYASGLLRNAIGPMEKLQRFGRVVALGVLWRDSVSFLYHAQTGMSSGEAIGRIGLFPATKSGVGMALLADASEEHVRQMYEDQVIPGFPRGIESLLTSLKQIKKIGYARIEVAPAEPLYPGEPHHTIAVPVGSPVTSALGMSGWIPESAIPDVVEALFAAKHDIETAEVNSEAPQLNIAELSERFNLHTVPPVYVDSPS
jgi:DNA-binding IclR family transcriptional regulator